jgi:SAM-dependent methyltransferase
MRQLTPIAEYLIPGLNLNVSDADTMLLDSDAHYLSVGRSALAVVEKALNGQIPESILDLPSGFGRVSRMLHARFPDASITACDLDQDGVDFCSAQFGAEAAYSVKDFRNLSLGRTFDLIWVGSLITHLPADQTLYFFEAMARHMTSRSTLVVTSHGPSIVPRLKETGYGLHSDDVATVIADYERCGFGYGNYRGGGQEYGVALSNDQYGISLASERWLTDTLSAAGLRMHGYFVQAWDDHHDVLVARQK